MLYLEYITSACVILALCLFSAFARQDPDNLVVIGKGTRGQQGNSQLLLGSKTGQHGGTVNVGGSGSGISTTTAETWPPKVVIFAIQLMSNNHNISYHQHCFGFNK